jgi:hypothetical protein
MESGAPQLAQEARFTVMGDQITRANSTHQWALLDQN